MSPSSGTACAVALCLGSVACGARPAALLATAEDDRPLEPARAVEAPAPDLCEPTAGRPAPQALEKTYRGVLAEARCQAEVGVIMRGVAGALGVKCKYCHVSGDFEAMTDRKLVANWMAVELVPKLRTRGGTEVACADCHRSAGEGAARILHWPRDRQWSIEWMTTVLVDRFETKDGDPLTCRGCHEADLGSAGFQGQLIGKSRLERLIHEIVSTPGG